MLQRRIETPNNSNSNHLTLLLEKPAATKADEFSEKFQTAFDIWDWMEISER